MHNRSKAYSKGQMEYQPKEKRNCKKCNCLVDLPVNHIYCRNCYFMKDKELPTTLTLSNCVECKKLTKKPKGFKYCKECFFEIKRKEAGLDPLEKTKTKQPSPLSLSRGLKLKPQAENLNLNLLGLKKEGRIIGPMEILVSGTNMRTKTTGLVNDRDVNNDKCSDYIDTNGDCDKNGCMNLSDDNVIVIVNNNDNNKANKENKEFAHSLRVAYNAPKKFENGKKGAQFETDKEKTKFHDDQEEEENKDEDEDEDEEEEEEEEKEEDEEKEPKEIEEINKKFTLIGKYKNEEPGRREIYKEHNDKEYLWRICIEKPSLCNLTIWEGFTIAKTRDCAVLQLLDTYKNKFDDHVSDLSALAINMSKNIEMIISGCHIKILETKLG